MKLLPILSLAILTAACASTPKTVATPDSTKTSAPEAKEAAGGDEEAAPKEEKSAAEKWAEAKMKDEKTTPAPSKAHESLDPLAMGGALEDASIPKIELTPKKDLRTKSRGDLDAAVALVRSSSSVDQAVAKITQRIGKPTWIENGKRRIWVDYEGAKCHKLTLDADGEVAVESASVSDWTMLAAGAHQNACTGEIKRGVQ